MQLFSEYIQPITTWLHANPEWALLITFLISFAESLAIIGSIIPGSITMTGIGILAGSGVMRVDLTLVAATLGAIVGDGISYLLGYFFSERLVTIWPFSRYPHWLNFGKDYFARHGGKSVIIGRFIGPLRSIIPVIAGMMHMSHWRFYIANSISAVFWSLLYVLPGVLLGAASSELPPESATQLLVGILCVLITIWLVTLFVKWALIKLNQFMNARLDALWQTGVKHRKLCHLFRYITPKQEKNHYPTAGLFICLSLLTGALILLSILVFTQRGIDFVNFPIHFAIQSLRNETLDTFFIYLTQSANYIALGTITTFTFILVAYHKKIRELLYGFSLIATTALCLHLMHTFIYSPRPTGILVIQLGYSFPSSTMTYATVLLSSLLLIINRNHQLKFQSSLNILAIVLLLLIGFGQLLLGDYWFTDIIGSYLLGLVISLTHWLFYRRNNAATAFVSSPLLGMFGLLFLAATSVACFLNFESAYKQHQRFITQYTFSNHVWWNQSKPLLPIYRMNRFGHPVSLFNIQYAGSLDSFSSALMTAGWSKQEESFTKSLMKRLGRYSTYRELPLMAQLYLNRKPSLIMTYKLKNHGPVLILRLWRSNYYLQDYQERIWIGSVHSRIPIKQYNPKTQYAITPLKYLEQALANGFSQRTIRLALSGQKRLTLRVAPSLLLVREEVPRE